MALRAFGAFAAGVAAGWGARSQFGSTREAMIRAIVATSEAREIVRRLAAERVEWVEDLLAEGRARYDALRASAPVAGDAPPRVVPIRTSERAA
jgi:hypothetical protein